MISTCPEIDAFVKTVYPGECQDPDKSVSYWIIRFAHPSGRLSVVQRTWCFCSAFAGKMSERVSGQARIRV
jgi:hypothetical protein